LSTKISVVIVDDSAFMRKAIEKMIEGEADISVVGIAKNGQEAVELNKKLHPDVITMDIEMPVMTGIEALKIIMRDSPTNVIMISSLTQEGADVTLEALQIGAVDFIPKKMSFVSLDIISVKQDLLAKIRAFASRKNARAARPVLTKQPIKQPDREKSTITSVKADLVTIGVSTGGPPALQVLVSQLPKDFPLPIMIVQHMPPAFTGPLAKRLNSLSQVAVKEAEDGDSLKPGTVYIAPGGKHMILKRRGIIGLTTNPMGKRHIPSVDVLDSSAANYYGASMIGVILTGMGSDGMEGLRECKKNGAYIIAQDEDSCVVYGMPRAVVDNGLADEVLPLSSIAMRLTELVK